jgi:hypothetical protein
MVVFALALGAMETKIKNRLKIRRNMTRIDKYLEFLFEYEAFADISELNYLLIDINNYLFNV